MSKKKTRGSLNMATRELKERCRDGAEFPDAAHRVAREYKVDQKELEANYDNPNAEREQVDIRVVIDVSYILQDGCASEDLVNHIDNCLNIQFEGDLLEGDFIGVTVEEHCVDVQVVDKTALPSKWKTAAMLICFANKSPVDLTNEMGAELFDRLQSFAFDEDIEDASEIIENELVNPLILRDVYEHHSSSEVARMVNDFANWLWGIDLKG